jgi:hypothetical protein
VDASSKADEIQAAPNKIFRQESVFREDEQPSCVSSEASPNFLQPEVMRATDDPYGLMVWLRPTSSPTD